MINLKNPKEHAAVFMESKAHALVYIPSAYSMHIYYPEALHPVAEKLLTKNICQSVECLKDGRMEVVIRLYDNHCRDGLQEDIYAQQWPVTIELVSDEDVSYDWLTTDYRWIDGKYMNHVIDQDYCQIDYNDVLSAFNANNQERLLTWAKDVKDRMQTHGFSEEDIQYAKALVLKHVCT